MASYSEEFMNLLEKILEDIDEIKKSIDKTFKENKDVCENHVEEATQVDVKEEDTIDPYVIPNESNDIDLDNMRDKDIAQPSNDEIDNKIIDKEKDNPHQNCDTRQDDVANNKHDQCIDSNATITIT